MSDYERLSPDEFIDDGSFRPIVAFKAAPKHVFFINPAEVEDDQGPVLMSLLRMPQDGPTLYFRRYHGEPVGVFTLLLDVKDLARRDVSPLRIARALMASLHLGEEAIVWRASEDDLRPKPGSFAEQRVRHTLFG